MKKAPKWFGTGWGSYSKTDWDEAVATGREAIIRRWAKPHDVGSYSDFIADVGMLDWPAPNEPWTDQARAQVGRLLGDIGVAEWLEDRPVLSALVVHKEEKRPGRTWYQLMREDFGFTESDDEKLWLDEVQRCWTFDW